MKISRLVVIDANAAWVKALFLAMPEEIEIRLLHVGQPKVFRNLSQKSWMSARRWNRCGPNASERWIIIPGWNKAPGISTWLTHRAVIAAAKGGVTDAQSTGIVLALPQYAGVAEGTKLRPRIYYAHDPFEFYGWDKDQTRTLENRMLNATDATFAISRSLRDDLMARTNRPIFYSPNAVSANFVSRLQNANAKVPDELDKIARPIVGCTGQINETYDWLMLGNLAEQMPDVSFVFIGPMQAPSEEIQELINSVLKGRSNVHWLGNKPHEELPNYLGAFDICLNPLTPSPHADRRSPLRLYDFLATGKPVVSTAIEEASSHEGQVWIGRNVAEIEAIIRQALSGQRQVDAHDRMNYIRRNTWPARARQVLEKIEALDQQP